MGGPSGERSLDGPLRDSLLEGRSPRASGDDPGTEEGEVASTRESEPRPSGGRSLVGTAPGQGCPLGFLSADPGLALC